MNKELRALSLVLFITSVLLLLAVASEARAQTVHVCEKGGKRIWTDRPCAEIGAETKQIRKPESFTPLSGGGGLTPGERMLMQQYRARDQAAQVQWDAERANDRQQAMRQAAQSQARCNQLNSEKNSIVIQQRQNSTQWLNDRRRAIDDEMYRLRCETL